MGIDPERIDRNRQAMVDHNLDLLVCRLPENVLLLTGYWPLSSAAFAIVPRDGDRVLIAADTEAREIPDGAAVEVRQFRSARLDARHALLVVEEELRDVLQSTGMGRARIGIELGFESVAPGHGAGEVLVPAAATQGMIRAAAPEAELVDATEMLTAVRGCKTPAEIAMLRQANEIAAFGLQAFRENFEPGRREAEVSAAVEAAILGRGTGHAGAKHVRAWAQLMTGPGSAEAYSLHPYSSARVIERGDLGLLELGTVVDGYWSDLSRTLVAGTAPNDEQQEKYAALVAAHHAVMSLARVGMTGGEVDMLARVEVERYGFGRLFCHQTGHGLGFRYHEAIPQIHPANQDRIEVGMVSSVEPGIYLEGFGGMRLEENVVFTENGVELLSHFSVDLAV